MRTDVLEAGRGPRRAARPAGAPALTERRVVGVSAAALEELADLAPAGAERFEDILTLVAVAFGVSVRELRSKRRTDRLAEPRFAACVLGRELTPLPLTALGGLLGGRDHTTVLHGMQRSKELVAAYPAGPYAVRLRKLRELLGKSEKCEG